LTANHARSKMSLTVLSVFTVLSILWISDIKAGEKSYPSYLELGITTSGLMIHPGIGYWFGRVGFRLTGMYLKKDSHEFHLNLGYMLRSSDKVQHGINLLTSRVVGSDPGADYKYWATGIAYSFNYRGLFIELGLAHPWKDDIGNLADDPVVPCGYLGYVHRFRLK